MSNPQVTTRLPHVLEDPSTKAVAHVYAIALSDAAKAVGNTEILEELDSFLHATVEASPEFRAILTTSLTSHKDKLGVIDRVVAGRASDFLTNFLRVLARHDRLDLLPLIAKDARLEFERRSNQTRVSVKSAVALTDAQRQRIADRLRDVFKFEPILQPTIDAGLLGGLVIQVGDTVYDSSLRTQLRVLRTRLRERYLNEIQSGRDRFCHSEGN